MLITSTISLRYGQSPVQNESESKVIESGENLVITCFHDLFML